MIRSVKITNFCSIGKTQEVSFDILSKDVLDSSAVNISDKNINLVNCFVGANASGKTTVLKGISFLFWLINDSYTSLRSDDNIPVEPHKLYEKELTRLEIEFFNQNTMYHYKIELDKKQIHSEYLGKHITRDYTRIFEYTRSEKDWNFKSSIEINKNDLLRFKERKNASVLSSLIETGYLPDLFFIKKCTYNVTDIGYFPYTSPIRAFLGVSKSLYVSEELQKEALSFVEDIDIGISSFEFKDVEQNGEKVKYLECVHFCESGEFKLPLINESNGTIRSLQLLIDIIPILKIGGVVILDEIEAGIHPYVVKKIISLFENRETNQHNSQLIFSTHQPLLLNDRTKTQIFIAEKENKRFETEIFRLDDVEGVRNDENYFHKYLAGAYGGIPHIKWIKS